MAGGWRAARPKRTEEQALRALVRAGCDPEVAGLLASDVRKRFPAGEERAKKLSEVVEFAKSIGSRAARDFFRAVGDTREIQALTDERVFAFARSVDPHTAEWYFWTIWGTHAVAELTDEKVLNAVPFFRSIDSAATVEYFFAIRESKAVVALTDPKVLDFALAIGSEAAVEYFGAFWETKAISELTSPKVLDFARSVGNEAAKEYFLTVRETKAVAELTESAVLDFARSLGGRVATDYFHAIRQTRGATELTNENVRIFVESIGKGPAEQYFRVIASTKAVAALTSENLFRVSGVIRAIGEDAALDYFLAAASTKVVPDVPGTGGAEGESPQNLSVPVLTLLDIPTYDRCRPVALVGLSAVFWLGFWQFSGVSGNPASAWVDVTAALGAWVVVLGLAYLLLGAVVQRSTDTFLERRRRLLNEHGIRWHDCLAGNQRCPVCWGAGHTHEDGRFDYGRFCRCSACAG